MSLETDTLIDRRHLRRKLTFWRIIAVGAAILALVGIGIAALGRAGFIGPMARPHIALIEIEGVITGSDRLIDLVKRVETSPMAQGVIVSIDSPGGTVGGSDRLYEALRELAAKKPVVARIENVAASGGYIAALAADHIVARGTSITGSIGVISQVPNASQLLKTLGLEMEVARSAPLKMMPSGVEPTTPAGKAAMQALVDDHFGWFKGLVKERRHLSDAQLAAVSDGRAFTGRQALPLRLVDALGSDNEVKAYFKTRNLDTTLPVETWKPRPTESEQSLLRRIFGASLALAGWPDDSLALRKAEEMLARNLLEGPLVLWQPANH